MNLKNCKYMNGEAFKERQDSFEFFCRQAYEFLCTFQDECRTGWREVFKTNRPGKKPMQYALSFMRSLTEWTSWTPEKNRILFN